MEGNAEFAKEPKEQVSEKTLDLDLDLIATTEASSIDFLSYEGFRAKIEKIEIIETINKWNKPIYSESGEITDYGFNPDSTELMQQVRITTQPLPVLRRAEDGSFVATEELASLGENKPLTVTARFNLVKTGETWSISKHPKAKLWKFMRKLNAVKLSELKGKFVTITLSEPDKESKQWLRIVV
jgi:hypothetical protein